MCQGRESAQYVTVRERVNVCQEGECGRECAVREQERVGEGEYACVSGRERG